MNLYMFIGMALAAVVAFSTGYKVGRESAAMDQFARSPDHVVGLLPGLTIEIPARSEMQAEAE